MKLITQHILGISVLLSSIASAAFVDANFVNNSFLDYMADSSYQKFNMIVAQAQPDVSKQESNTFGVCTLVENPVDPLTPFGTVMAPDISVTNYYRNILGKNVNYKGNPANIVEGPKHGVIEKLEGVYGYRANKDYLGGDQVTFEMYVGDKKVKIIHFITVQKLVSGDMYEDKEYCPRGAVWMINL